MMHKTAWSFALVFAWSVAAHGQVWRGTGRIAGTVVDSAKKPVVGAKVVVRTEAKEGPAEITSDKNGKWVAGGLAGGSWHVDFHAEGFVTRQITVKINEMQRVPPLQVVLERAAPAPPPVASVEQSKPEIQVGGQSVAPEIATAIEAGNRYMEQEKHKEAIAEYEKAQAALPTNIPLKQALARAYYASGQLKPAVGLLKDVYSADPSNTTIAMLYANVLIEDAQLNEAKKILDAIPSGEVTDPTVMMNVGILFLNKNKPVDALLYFDRAVGIDPKRGESYYYRALSYVQLDRRAAARLDLEKFIELSPDADEAADAREMLKALK